MKRFLFAAGFAMALTAAYGQSASDYIVKTKGVQATIAAADEAGESGEASQTEEEAPKDFIGLNFKFYSLCDWKEDMKFMVLPDKYDLIVRTFCDAETNKEVSSMTLRYKIMLYKGHTETPEGHARINFLCQDNGKRYYYEIPHGTFEDYCYSKAGVPTLAYLGDVDIAREKLIGKELFTKTTTYFVDTNLGEGFEEVSVPSQTEVKIVKIGVGTRSFPVKIIVADHEGREFYQNVALSKTNSGMSDSNFELLGNSKHLFYNSFQLLNDNTRLPNMSDYVGKVIHTKVATKMQNDQSQKQQGVPPMIGFYVQETRRVAGKPDFFLLRLKNEITDGIFFKEVCFTPKADNVAEGYKVQDSEYFDHLFSLGSGRQIATSQGSRAMINVGHVSPGFTEDEVLLAAGVPDDTKQGTNGQYDWIYKRSNNQLLHVTFTSGRLVLKTWVDKSGVKKRTTPARRRRR